MLEYKFSQKIRFVLLALRYKLSRIFYVPRELVAIHLTFASYLTFLTAFK